MMESTRCWPPGGEAGITYPEIYQMQIQAILEQWPSLLKEGVQVQPEIMVLKSAQPGVKMGSSTRQKGPEGSGETIWN